MQNQLVQTLWGIDLGGSKIEGAIMPASGPSPICRIRIPTEQQGGYEHILRRIAILLDSMSSESGISKPDRIGLSMPGTIEPSTGLAKNANTTCLNGRPLRADLETTLGVEVMAANDANCFALAESLWGAAQYAQVVFGVILGTGVGGGLIVEGKIVPGHHGIAGEWGHNPLVTDGEPCYCGKRGCVETVLSGPSLEQWYSTRSGQPASLREIATSDDPIAIQTIDRLCDYFGRAMASVVNVVDPDVIVVGGGVGNVAALYTRGRESLASRIFNPAFEAKLVAPMLGDSAGVFGAAILSAK